MHPSGIKRIPLALAGLIAANLCWGQGMPVIDHANLVQAIQQLQAWEQQWHQMNQQLQQQIQQNRTTTRQLEASTGSRQLGTVHNEIRTPSVESGFAQTLAATSTHAEAARLVDLQAQRINYATQHRFQQIQALMQQINVTNDAKGVQEINARIGAEQAMLAAEQKEMAQLQQDFLAQLARIDRNNVDAQRRALRTPLRSGTGNPS